MRIIVVLQKQKFSKRSMLILIFIGLEFVICGFRSSHPSITDESCLSIITIASMDFGWMINSHSKTISASEPGAMCFKITGRKGSQVLVCVPTQLQLGAGANVPLFTRGAVMYSTTSSQSGLVTFINAGVSSGVVTLPHAGGGGNQRSVWIWIGGTMSIPSGSSSGSKSGTLTVQIHKMDD